MTSEHSNGDLPQMAGPVPLEVEKLEAATTEVGPSLDVGNGVTLTLGANLLLVNGARGYAHRWKNG